MQAKSLKQRIIDKAVEARLLVPVQVKSKEQPQELQEYHRNLETESPMLDALAGPVAERLRTVVHGSTHFLIIGKKESGKTCLASYLLEGHHEAGRSCFVYRPPKPELWPEWVTPIYELTELPENSVVLIDEAPLQGFNQFSYQKRGTLRLAEIMEIARHNNQSLIIVSPNSPDLTRKLIYPVDVYLLKQPSPFQRLEERRIIKAAYEKIPDLIAKNEYYWLDGEIFEKATFTKPAWYSEELSKAYRNYTPSEHEAAANPARKFRTYFSEPSEAARRLPLDPSGILLSAIVGTAGVLTLLKGAWQIALPCLGLAGLGLFFSQRRFDRKENEDHQ